MNVTKLGQLPGDLEARAGASDRDRERWLEERRAGVTSTQLRDILLAPDEDLAIADLIRKKREGDPFTGNEYTRWGTDREPVIAAKLAGFGVIPESRVFHAEHNSRILASPDGFSVDFDGNLHIEEIKTSGAPLPKGSEDLAKKGYEWQLQGNCLVTGAVGGYLTVELRYGTPRDGFEPGEISREFFPRDEQMIAELQRVADKVLAAMDGQTAPVIDEVVDTHALNYLRGLAAEKEGRALKESAYAALIEAGVSQESPLARVTFTPSKEKPPVEVVEVDEETAKLTAPQVWAKVHGARKRAELAEAQWAEVLAAHTTKTTQPGGSTPARVTVTAGKGTKK